MLVSDSGYEEKPYHALDCHKENPEMARIVIGKSPILLLCVLLGTAAAVPVIAADGKSTFTFRSASANRARRTKSSCCSK